MPSTHYQIVAVIHEFNIAFSLGTADRQSNMQMNKPVWIVEDKALKESEEGRKKLQQVADDHDKPNTASRLTIVHGGDFDKVTIHTAFPWCLSYSLLAPLQQRQSQDKVH